MPSTWDTGLPQPVVGYYGALDDYLVDEQLLIKVARSIPGGTLVLIGPKAMDTSALEKEPNVRYLGPIPYERLPQYARVFQVGLMPWLQNDWIASCNPIKLKEYLALGFPVVSTPFPELEPYRDMVYGAAGHEEFVAAVHQALRDGDGSQSVHRRREAVRQDSWAGLAEKSAGILGLKT
jgi:glycosyltransferase involved in cell wall biosynthesis